MTLRDPLAAACVRRVRDDYAGHYRGTLDIHYAPEKDFDYDLEAPQIHRSLAARDDAEERRNARRILHPPRANQP